MSPPAAAKARLAERSAQDMRSRRPIRPAPGTDASTWTTSAPSLRIPSVSPAGTPDQAPPWGGPWCTKAILGPPALKASAQTTLESLELSADLGRELVAELGEVLLHLGQLLLDLLEVDGEEIPHRLNGDVEPLGVDLALGRQQPDRGLDRLGFALAAAEDPCQHAAVLAEAGPEELALVVFAEPVDVEDARQLGTLAPAELQPVGEVVAHVVAAEGQHRHRAEAQLTDGAGRGGGRLRRHRRPHEDGVLPVEGLLDQGHHGGAAAAEEEGVDRHAGRVLPLGRDRRAMGGGGGGGTVR